MECLRCGNKDAEYFYNDHGTYYCRKCIHFGRINANELPQKHKYRCKRHQIEIKLDYELTAAQKLVSDSLVRDIVKYPQILVNAVCGSGKTEIVLEVIKEYLNDGKKVGFAISRRQVVIEIKERLSSIFNTIKVICVCEGFTKITDGDLIVATMHQLYRYYDTFDLLIMDEIDAFPYANNEVLEKISLSSVKKDGHIIYLSATPDDLMIQKVKNGEIKMYELYQRPHGYPLIVPKIKYRPWILAFIEIFKQIKYHYDHHISLMIFTPSINMCNLLNKLCPFPSVGLTSKTVGKEELINKFKNHEVWIMFATTIMERGITIEGVNVVVLNAESEVYSLASLIQMSGRVGRKFSSPSGEAIYINQHYSKKCLKSIRMIERMNHE